MSTEPALACKPCRYNTTDEGTGDAQHCLRPSSMPYCAACSVQRDQESRWRAGRKKPQKRHWTDVDVRIWRHNGHAALCPSSNFSTSYQSNVKLLIRGLRPKLYLGPVTGGIGRSGRASPSPPPSVRRWVSMVSGSRTNGDAFGIGPRTPLLRCLSTSSLSRL